MSGGGTAGSAAGSPSRPENMAKAAYNSGVGSIKKAEEYESDAAKASNPQKSAKALDKAHQYYSKAVGARIRTRIRVSGRYPYRKPNAPIWLLFCGA
jgi:hypothetical protein